MAAAAGMSGIPTGPSADGRWKRGDVRITQAIPIAAANAIHLSCWRSSPRARRSRTTREAAAARPSTNISSTPATWRLYPILKLVGAEAGALSLRFTSNGPRTAHPVTAMGTTTRKSATPDSQATGRHRREGRWPSGNNRIRNVKSTRMPGLHVNVPSHDMKPPNGNIPGRSTKALVAHSVLRAARPNDRPIPQNSHPIGLLGRWAAMSAPSTEKDVTTTIPNSPKPASELWSALAIQTAAPSIAMEATALLHAATEAVRCCIYTPPAWVRRHLARSRHPGEGALTSEMEGFTRPRRADRLRRSAPPSRTRDAVPFTRDKGNVVQPVHHDLSQYSKRPLQEGLRWSGPEG